MTEKLKTAQTSALSRLTKSRNALSALLLKPADHLQDVKSALDNFDALLNAYQNAHAAYMNHLSSTGAEDVAYTEGQRYHGNECTALDFRVRVLRWITEAERELFDDMLSSASARTAKTRSSRASSRSSASSRSREVARIAELKARQKRLDLQLDLERRKNDLKAEEKKFVLSTELEVAEARYHALADGELTQRRETKPLDPYALPFEPHQQEVPQHAFLPPSIPQSTLQPVSSAVLQPDPSPVLQQDLQPAQRSAPQPSLQSAPRRPSHSSSSSDASASSIQRRPSTSSSTTPDAAASLTPSQPSPPSLEQLVVTMSLPQGQVPTFSGDCTQYHTFINAFNSRISSRTSNASDLLYYLNQYLVNEPKELISGCLLMSPELGYSEAMALLKKEYGNSYVVSSAYIDKLTDWPLVRADDPSALKSLSTFLSRTMHAMQNCSDLSILDHLHNLKLIVSKLPARLQGKWRDHVNSKLTTAPKFSDLVHFVQKASKSDNDPVFGRTSLAKVAKPKSDAFKGANASSKPKAQNTQNFAVAAATTSKCPLCESPHNLADCQTFAQHSVKDRRTAVKDLKLCFACFSPDHVAKNCSVSCTICQKKHNTLVHVNDSSKKKVNANVVKGDGGGKRTQVVINNSSPAPSTPPTNPTANTVSSNACSVDRTDTEIVLHPIVPVKVHFGDRFVITYAFFDCGSSACFIADDVARSLGAQGTRTTLEVKTLNGSSKANCNTIENLVITDMHGNNAVSLPKCYTQQEIPVDRPNFSFRDALSLMPGLEEAVAEMPPPMADVSVGLLIGSNCPRVLQPLRVIPSEGDGPFAVKHLHGWTISGPVAVRYDSRARVTCHRIQISETRVKELPTSDILAALNQDFRDLDQPSAVYDLGQSQEDKRFLSIVESSIGQRDGHFVMPLPFRDENVRFPSNKALAVGRAESLKKKLANDENFKRDYVAFVDSLLKNGYARKLLRSEIRSDNVWYLPHHGVYHPFKKKIRVVFDCSAKFKGVSLNDTLLQGPDLLNPLVGVLCRFRNEPVAFIGDIEAMFHQVRVIPEHQNYLRFLWWPDGDFNQPLHEYAMTVHIFGATSSPCMANLALRKTADLAEGQFGVKVADIMRRNFYVDDCLASVGSDAEAIALVSNLKDACLLGGFKLAKFCSNNVHVIESLPLDERSKSLQKYQLGEDLPGERALGVFWDPNRDVLGFELGKDVGAFHECATRRSILSAVATIYDPLGIVAPFVLVAKNILQVLCKLPELGWDDPISQELSLQWKDWCNALPIVATASVKRCLKPCDATKDVVPELHLFSDASSHGYGVVAFVRYASSHNEPAHCSFLMGKSRVAPHKTTTIPRLELTAAFVAARMGRMLSSEMNLNPSQVWYHTDSTTVLHYIRSKSKRFPVFVANRIQAILDLSDVSHWQYVDTKSNPADIASRGTLQLEAINSLWLSPPAFLAEPRNSWPPQPTLSQQNEVNACSNLTVTSENPTQRLLNHFSSWHRLKFAVAVFEKLKSILRERVRAKGSAIDSALISLSDLERAEMHILKHEQRMNFEKEISALSSEKPVPKSSSVYKLDAMMLDDGLLRVGGRLSRSDLPVEAKHPILLPKRSHVTDLIARDAHIRLGHAGRYHVLSDIREKYWIIHGNALVRKVISNCYYCRRTRGPIMHAKMADLPEERCSDAPPFTFSGVDLFGPFQVKNGRKIEKRYGVLFTCLASRAVHIEMSSSLETDSFLQALRRFIARRGPISQLRCDNATNFRGAERELQRAMQEINNDDLRYKLLKENIDWVFNPPYASHMGGIWERQIRSVRKVMSGLHACDVTLDDEAFHTLLCEIEYIINSSPLTTPSSDPNDLCALSPSNILTHKTSTFLPPPGVFQRHDVYCRKRWRKVQYLADQFWFRWRKEFLVEQQQRSKWVSSGRSLKPGDIVIMKDHSLPRNCWPLARVERCFPSNDGLIRSVEIKTKGGIFKRPVSNLVYLVGSDDL